MIQKYYTPEQLDYLQKRREEVGDERMQEGPQRWADLSSAVQAEIDAGTDPSDPKVQELARRWFGLVNEFTGGDPSIFNSLRNMYQNEDRIHGMDIAATWQPMMEYIGKAASGGRARDPRVVKRSGDSAQAVLQSGRSIAEPAPRPERPRCRVRPQTARIKRQTQSRKGRGRTQRARAIDGAPMGCVRS